MRVPVHLQSRNLQQTKRKLTWMLFFHRLGSPGFFYGFAGRLLPCCGVLTLVFLVPGLLGGLVFAPPDYEQGDGFRIIYVHVPAAWMSLFIYTVMAVNGLILLVWRVKLMDAMARASAPLGASYTLLTLLTGSLWGKPMWGAWWVWDARLTSELILLFLYLGYLGLVTAIDDRRIAGRAGALLTLVGVINIPVIHYSVVWWHTLHQPASIARFGAPAIHTSMLLPLLCMAAAFLFFYCYVLLVNTRSELLVQEKRSRWAQQLVEPV